MSEIIERMAKAICDGHTSGNADFDEVPEQYRNSYRDAAVAALKALSSPTYEMAVAGNAALSDNGLGDLQDDDAQICFSAMIDAALASEPTE